MAATVGAEALALDWERGMDGYAENEVRGRAAVARSQAPAGVAGGVARGRQPVWEQCKGVPRPKSTASKPHTTPCPHLLPRLHSWWTRRRSTA